MTEQQTSQLLNVLADFDYQGDFDKAMRLGEVPWKANRAALRSLDIMLDAKKGESDVEMLLDGATKLLVELRKLEHAAGRIKGAASSVLR